MLLLGQTFDAHEALAWSFVERVVPVDQLDEATEIWVDQILSISQRAMRLQKALIRSWEDLPLRAAVQAGIDSFERAFETDELAKAMAEFLAAQATGKGEA
ncbi:MAG: hypothetical protein QOF70_778 [Acetobacteraceae bacterium]|nr:hypothetical protein [Acetobacteraceae bacterium]